MRSAPGTSGIKTIHRAAGQSSYNTREDAKLDADQEDPDHDDLLLAAHSVHEAHEHACSNEFWKTMERFFAPVTVGDLPLLKYQIDPTMKLNQTGSPILTDVHVATGVATKSSSGAECCTLSQGSIISTKECNSNQGRSNTFAYTDDDFFKYMGDTELQSGLDLEFQNYFLDRLSGGSSISSNKSSKRVVSNTFSNDAQWRALFPDEKLSQELQSLSWSCKPALGDEVLIDTEIRRLQEEHYQHAANVKKILGKIVAPVQCELQSNKRSLEESAMNQLVQMSYNKVKLSKSSKKQQSKYSRKSRFSKLSKSSKEQQHKDSGKSCFSKLSKSSTVQSSQRERDFANRTLARCRQFEDSGKSCFSEPHLQEILYNSPPRKIVSEPASSLLVPENAKRKGSDEGSPVSRGKVQHSASSSRLKSTTQPSKPPSRSALNKKKHF